MFGYSQVQLILFLELILLKTKIYNFCIHIYNSTHFKINILKHKILSTKINFI